MGTEIVITAALLPDEEYMLDEAERAVHDFERRFGRFVPGSELNQLNIVPAGSFAASRGMIDLLTQAKHFYEETGGIFDPTIIGSLERVGYEKSFGEIEEDVPDGGEAPDTRVIQRAFLDRPKMDDLRIEGGIVVKPEGFRIDLGGIGKGYIADVLGNGLFADVPDVWISAGGDLFVKGSSEGAVGWWVGVQDPHTPAKEAFSIQTSGEKLGIATSGIFKRKGVRGGFEWHHLIDPRTGLPVENDILAVTVVSMSAMQADVFAKTVLVLGQEKGLEFIDAREDSACVIFLKERGELFSKRAANYFGH